jgi:hypothetical protein
MSKSKLLKEAIADAKAVRETAIANAKIALEEAFTPRLQSILSKKLQAEMEGDEEELEEEYSDGSEAPTTDSSDLGTGDNKQPANDANSSSDLAQGNPDTDVESSDAGKEDDNIEVVAEEEEFEGEDDVEVSEEEEEEVYEEEDEDTLDLEAIIRELEGEDSEEIEEEEIDGVGYEDPTNADDVSVSEEEEIHAEPDADNMGGESDHDADNIGEEEDDVIDLDEILREMGYGDDEEVSEEEEEDHSELEAELEEAYKVIKSLKSTINEVNLLNAKLLYTNKLFRGYDLTNEQKVKVVENLDRTTSVREVKLVYATLAESMKFGNAPKKVKKNITEGFASKPTKSTAPAKEVITENANVLAERFKQLAGIK